MRTRGQVLILLAVSLGVAAAAALTFLALSTLESVRSHARQSLQTAVFAGSRTVDYDPSGSGAVIIREDAAETTREVFGRALALSRYGLGADPWEISGNLLVEVHNEVPWHSPYTGLDHQVPTLFAGVQVPVRVLFFTVDIPVQAEAEANVP